MKKIILSSVCIAILCGCGLTRKDLGLEKDTPDEMLVISRAPLSIPPEFGLRPIIVQNEVEEDEVNLTAGEEALLQKIK